jgi:hypothetical protein
MAETITLEFLAAQQRRILDELALMRDDIKALTAIVLRHEETMIRILEQITAMVGQMPGSSTAYGLSRSA